MKTAAGRLGQLSSVKRQVEQAIQAATGAALTARESLVKLGVPIPSLATSAGVLDCIEVTAAAVAGSKMAPSVAGAITALVAQAIALAQLQAERDMIDLELRASTRPASGVITILPAAPRP